MTLCALTFCCRLICIPVPFLLLTNVNPASVQAFHGDVEPLSLLTQPVGHWHGTVLKYNRSSWLRVPTHLEDERTRSGRSVSC